MIDSSRELTDYMNTAVSGLITDILKSGIRNPREALFLLHYRRAQKKAGRIRSKHERSGLHIPAFLICSVTRSCNLRCAGCYARSNGLCGESESKNLLSADEWGRIFTEAEKAGCSFALLAGGEPMMRRDVILKASAHKKLIFPIFTNGTLIESDDIELFSRKRNLVPVLSIEGGRTTTDARRGAGVYDKLLEKMHALNENAVLYGASVTVNRANLGEAVSEEFLDALKALGCRLVFYIEYVPVDASEKDLAFTEADRSHFDEKRRVLGLKYPGMVFLAFPGDEKKLGGCLAAGRGFFHINPDGSAEPCPFSPYSDMDLRKSSFTEVLRSPLFKKLCENGLIGGKHDGGCALFERDAEVRAALSGTAGTANREK
jgi:MoaA/NifB/PqqE/SkfB family radical SAM enzyme